MRQCPSPSLLILALSLALGACAAPSPRAVTEAAPMAAAHQQPSEAGELLFTSMRTGSPQIFRIGADGSGELRLTRTEYAELQPVWSRSGRIAFVSYRSGGGDIYTMNADGGDVRRVTDWPGLEQNPSWSPDGKHLTFVGERDGKAVLAVVNADGSGLRMVSGSLSEVAGPAWSPDGDKIAFVAALDNRPRIVVADLVRQAVEPVDPQGLGREFGPIWSPDGRSIAYVVSGSRTEGVNLRLMRLGETSPVALTANAYINSQPQFSPDGSKLLFLSNAASQGGYMKLHVMNADGRGVRPLTDWEDADMGASWSADGRQIYFMSFRDWPGQVYRANVDGSDVRRLTRTRTQEGIPVVRLSAGAVPNPTRSH